MLHFSLDSWQLKQVKQRMSVISPPHREIFPNAHIYLFTHLSKADNVCVASSFIEEKLASCEMVSDRECHFLICVSHEW